MLRTSICAALLLTACAWAQEKSVKPGINDHFKDPDLKKYLGTFEGESREIFAQREAILKACKVKPGMAIADVGAGTGLFTRLFARATGPKGKVYAVDIAQKFLDHIARTAREEKLENIVPIRCTQTSSELPPASVDLVFICDTYHHFEFPHRTLATLHKALRPGGRIVLIDFHRIPGKTKKWTMDHVRAGQEVFTKEIADAGFRVVGEEKELGLKENYFVTFEKKAEKKEGKAGPLRFNRDLRPILADNCFTCHGPDRAKRKGDLRLDTPEGARGAVVPGKPEESELVKRLLSDDPHRQMPPAKAIRRPSKSEVALLRQWIAEGAKWEPHWSFVRPVQAPPPATASPAGNPIDAFLLERLEKAGLTFSVEAPRSTLIRRVTFDLTGLPPTLDEVTAFLGDTRPDAYERLVDRLLASPRLGERLALDWLDSARYADSNGYQSDRDRVMWPWRDWVVRQFNANTPFSCFTLEQIAGDLLPDATLEQKLATGFHRNLPLNGEGGRIAEESRVDYVVDRVDTTAAVWLGLTLGCARCHDHKYDPFTARDYYRLSAYFNSIDETGAVDRGGNANPVLELPTPQQAKRIEELRGEVAAAEARAKASPPKVKPSADKEVKARRDALAAFEKTVLNVMVMRDRPKPRDTHILIRGAYDKPGEKVTHGVLEMLSKPPSLEPNRLALAKWLIDPANPLPARVIVNRYWQLLFGAGIVRTPEDFGVQGEPPTHPELLDWLAVDLQQSGWDLKRLLRLLVTSRAYRQSSAVTPALREADPQNRLLARAPRLRLPSVMIRDQALALSGLLAERIGGPPVKPYQPPGIWEEFSFGFIRYVQDHGEKLYRRGLYIFWRRTVAPTNLFDVAARQVCEVKPVRTNTPLHALVTLNDVTYAEAHRALASRVLREGGDDRAGWLFRLVTARMPTERERAVLTRALEKLRSQYRADPASARSVIRAGESPVDEKADAVELAAWTGLCSLVLNLDEALTRE
jgi:ubiquinone/menaquinone biosynthesis C-methylase UbiE